MYDELLPVGTKVFVKGTLADYILAEDHYPEPFQINSILITTKFIHYRIIAHGSELSYNKSALIECEAAPVYLHELFRDLSTRVLVFDEPWKEEEE